MSRVSWKRSHELHDGSSSGKHLLLALAAALHKDQMQLDACSMRYIVRHKESSDHNGCGVVQPAMHGCEGPLEGLH